MAMIAEPSIIHAWLRAFKSNGDYVLRPREIVRRALSDPQTGLLDAISSVIPGFAEHPHPSKLSRWLRSVENLPMVDAKGACYRFMLTEAGAWDLVPVKERERSAA